MVVSGEKDAIRKKGIEVSLKDIQLFIWRETGKQWITSLGFKIQIRTESYG
jgi:hypothetical protein